MNPKEATELKNRFPSGTKVIFDQLNKGYPDDQVTAKKYLVKDEIYTVLHQIEFDQITYISFEGIPNQLFNSQQFSKHKQV